MSFALLSVTLLATSCLSSITDPFRSSSSEAAALDVPYTPCLEILLTPSEDSYVFTPAELRPNVGDTLKFDMPQEVEALQAWRSDNPCLDPEPSPTPQWFPAQSEANSHIVRLVVNSSENYYFSPAGQSLCRPDGGMFTLLPAATTMLETSQAESQQATSTTKTRSTRIITTTTTMYAARPTATSWNGTGLFGNTSGVGSSSNSLSTGLGFRPTTTLPASSPVDTSAATSGMSCKLPLALGFILSVASVHI